MNKKNMPQKKWFLPQNIYNVYCSYLNDTFTGILGQWSKKRKSKKVLASDEHVTN